VDTGRVASGSSSEKCDAPVPDSKKGGPKAAPSPGKKLRAS
jgi:hypothetical protein